MKSPRSRGEVTKEWVEFMLTEFENRSTPGSKVTIKTWEAGDATKKGDGYSGDLLKLEVKATVQQLGESIDKEYNHIIKFTTQDPIQKEFGKVLGNAEREFLIYSEILEQLNMFQAKFADNKFPIYFPNYVFGRHNDKEHVLVMENMKIDGYENKLKSEFLNFNEAKIALEQLARLHAISYAYDKVHKITEKYKILDDKKWHPMMTAGTGLFVDMLLDFLKFKGEHQSLIDKISSSKPEIIAKIKTSFATRNQPQIFCLNHGDPWNNNILLKKSEDNSENNTSVCFIDWELVHWNTTAYDLNYFLGGAVTPEIRMKHLDELLQHYHNHFTEVTTAIGKPIPNWSYQSFKNEYDDVSIWGFMKGLGFCLIISEASKEWEFSNHKPTKNPVLKSIKKGFGKAMVPLFMKPSMMEKMMSPMLKKMIDPVLKEMKSGKNPQLNERLLANILEGEKRGFFDIHEQ